MTTFPSECVGKRRAERASDGRRVSSGDVGNHRHRRRRISSNIVVYRRDTDVGFRRNDVGPTFSAGFRRDVGKHLPASKNIGPTPADVGNYRHRHGRRRISSESVGTPTSNIVEMCRDADVGKHPCMSALLVLCPLTSAVVKILCCVECQLFCVLLLLLLVQKQYIFL